MNDSITKERVLNHSIDNVWRAISNAEELSTWFVRANFKAEVGYQYTFDSLDETEDCSTIIGEVLSASPYVLSYTWIVKTLPETTTTVTWRLEAVEGGTKLHLEHSGISNYAGDTAVTWFNNFNGGWNNCIEGLHNYLKQTVNAG